MNRKKLPGLISVLILTLLTSILWVSFDVYRALTTKPEESVPVEISNPITPSLDQTTISKIEAKMFLDSSQIPDNVIITASLPVPSQEVQTPIPTPTPIATPVASPSGTPTGP